ncbi:transporter [Croceitalea marina]|uniref:Transporter n=1 Tax=Croceitalea marina TaxID=1775166 RepID=A0ABW5MZ50_9FLAO|tara:strand:+ start:256 stop:1002 length:747 start_codon:yes stop_codon:yes gene_type:complete
MREIAIIVILTIGIFSNKLNAQIVTDRPDQTESSSTVPKGSLQLESGILIGYEGENQESKRQLLLPTNLFRYGIANWMELRILNQFELLKLGENRFEGIGDLEIGTKIQIIKGENKNTEVAFLTHLIIPTGQDGLTSEKFGSSNKLSISHGINENIGLGYNLGYNYFGDGKGDFTYSIALGIGINSKVGIYVEPYGEIANMKEHFANFDTGFTYLANKNLQFDFSFGTGINWTMNYMSIGCSWLIEKK